MTTGKPIEKMTIKIIDGVYFLENKDGRFVWNRGIEDAIQGLKNTLSRIHQHDSGPEDFGYWEGGQEDVVRDVYIERIYNILDESKGIKLSPERYRHPGVYFMSHPKMRRMMKIGRSEYIHSRIKQHAAALGEGNLKVHAVIRHEDHKILENALHNIFSQWHVTGEWFDFEPVYDWLKDPYNFSNWDDPYSLDYIEEWWGEYNK